MQGTNYNQSWSGNLAPNKETLVSITLLGTSLSNNVNWCFFCER